MPHNGSLRFNCPICRGFYTLGITKQDGKLKWHCFKASCDTVKGNTNYLRSSSELKTALEGRTEGKKKFTLPDHLIYGLSSKKTLQMIIRGNCLDSYSKGLFDAAYDPVQDRVCFIVKQGNEIVGLIGKACTSNTRPKVLNYPNSDISTPFVCGNSDTIVLVEDCLSAASVARIPELTGMALLGSSLKNEYIPLVRKYNKVIVALDRDARKKALAIKMKLCYYHQNVKLWMINQDIKDMNNEDLLGEYKSLGTVSGHI